MSTLVGDDLIAAQYHLLLYDLAGRSHNYIPLRHLLHNGLLLLLFHHNLLRLDGALLDLGLRHYRLQLVHLLHHLTCGRIHRLFNDDLGGGGGSDHCLILGQTRCLWLSRVAEQLLAGQQALDGHVAVGHAQDLYALQ